MNGYVHYLDWDLNHYPLLIISVWKHSKRYFLCLEFSWFCCLIVFINVFTWWICRNQDFGPDWTNRSEKKKKIALERSKLTWDLMRGEKRLKNASKERCNASQGKLGARNPRLQYKAVLRHCALALQPYKKFTR